MGLDTTHDAWHGAYSAFNRFRQAICEATGGSFPPHWQYEPDGTLKKGQDGRVLMKEGMNEEFVYMPDCAPVGSGLREFLMHSDCDGEISPEMCVKVADELESILPKIEALGWIAGGHIAARGGFVEVTRKFIAGCRAAAAENVPLGFH